jgi:signal transduction histidine kinase
MAFDAPAVQTGYILVFSLTAVVCFGAISRAGTKIEDRDTQWGLVSLLALSGFWSAFHVGRLVVSSPQLQVTFYILGLSVGLATVGSWLYFCSAYANESYHRERTYRWLAVGFYVAIILVKFTSPLHGLYFSTTPVAEPFPHLEIQLGVLHWVVTGIAYSLSAVGFYVLFDLFRDSAHATRRLSVVVGLAGLPVAFDIVSYVVPGTIITLNYEPIGVGLFTVGVLYLADGTFLAVRKFGREQLIDELDEGIILLDDGRTIHDTNSAARTLFPSLERSTGRQIDTAAPDLASYLPLERSRIVTFDSSPSPRYYFLSAQPLTAGQTLMGQAIVLTDVTEVERQRRKLQRQQTQFDDFAEAITHELRNTINIVQNHLQLVETTIETEQDRARESLGTALDTTDRMTAIVGNLATLARFGHTVDQTTTIDTATAAREAFESVATDDHRLTVSGATTIEADRARLNRLFETLFEFALSNGATEVEVAQENGALVVTDNGQPLSDGDAERAFSYGEAVPDAESGMLLPVVRTLVEAHGWEVRVVPEYMDGVRIVITHGDGDGDANGL